MKIYRTSKNLNMTDEIKQSLISILPQIMQDIDSFENKIQPYLKKITPKNVTFTDPYKNQKVVIPISYQSSATDSLGAQTETFGDEIKVILNIPKDESHFTKNPDGSNNYTNRKTVPKVPFIPAFAMDIKKICTSSNITNIEIKQYGHCDILDIAFSNIMHNSFAEGNDDRNSLNEYRLLINELITLFINDNDFTDKLLENHNERFNIEYTVN